MSRDLPIFWIVVVLADGLMLGQCIYLWRVARRKDPTLRLNFHLIELWSAALGVSASIAIVGTMLQSPGESAACAPLVASLLIPHQLGSIFIFTRTEYRPLPVAKSSSTDLFLRTLMGALCGLFVPCLTLFWLGLTLLVLAAAIGLWPITLFTIITALIYRGYKTQPPLTPSSPSIDIGGIPPPSAPRPPLPPMTGSQLR